MSRAAKKKIIWFEDNLNQIRNIKEELSKKFDIVNARNRAEFDSYDLASFDGIVLDNKIEKDRRAGEKLLESLVGELNNISVLVLTAFPSEKFDNIVKKHSINNVLTHVMAKNFYITEGTVLSNIVNIFTSMFINMEIPKCTDRDIEESLTLESFNNLPLRQQQKYSNEVYDEYEQIIEDYFLSGVHSLLFWYRKSAPYMAFYKAEECLSDDEIRQRSSANNDFPIIFDNSEQIDEIICPTNANGRLNMDNYPIIQFRMNEDYQAGFHFDTGADSAYINEDFINEFNLENQLTASGAAKMQTHRALKIKAEGNKLYPARTVKIKIQLVLNNPSDVEDEFGSTKVVDIDGHAVADWEYCTHNFKCAENCSHKATGQKMCKYRENGLIGRAIMKNEIDFILRYGNSHVTFKEEDS